MKWRLPFLFFFLPAVVSAQVRSLTGVVLDGNAVTLLPGVEIRGSWDTAAVTTDEHGKFEMKAPREAVSLQFRIPGYRSGKEEIPAGRHFTTVFLYPDPAGPKQQLRHTDVITGMKAHHDEVMPVAVKTHQDETYEQVAENPFKQALAFPFSSFILNADDASFCNVRRFITNKELPPKEAVRVEEMVNHLPFGYAADAGPRMPMSLNTTVTTCPWKEKHWLLQVSARARELPRDTIIPDNLVLLVDISGSMESRNKLPLLKKTFRTLVNQLDSLDKIAVVVYAGNVAVALPPTSCYYKNKILDVINNLSAGGSTAGKAGIETAFKLARKNFIPQGNNRVIMATDGDFNVGESSDEDMRKLITRYHDWGIYLTCIGVGKGNYKDSKLETLAHWGQGNFIYLDNEDEAARIFDRQSYRKILVTSVRNARVKIIFNPERVRAYRLIGYESRNYGNDSLAGALPGGEIGYGQRITAFYELAPASNDQQLPAPHDIQDRADISRKLATAALQYETVSDQSQHLQMISVPPDVTVFGKTDQGLQFAAAVTLFGMLLRHSDYAGDGTYGMVTRMVRHIKDPLYKDERKAFLKLVQKAAALEKGREGD